jgi:hypothetical protein
VAFVVENEPQRRRVCGAGEKGCKGEREREPMDGPGALRRFECIVRAKAPSPLRSAGAVHSGSARVKSWFLFVTVCLKRVVESARQGMSDAKRCSLLEGRVPRVPLPLLWVMTFPHATREWDSRSSSLQAYLGFGSWSLGFARCRAPVSLWTSRPRSCTILFMGVWFPFIDDQALHTPLILRIVQHTPVTRANQPRSNSHLLPFAKP